MKNANQILPLIESDVISSKLVNTFNSIGIDANLYLTDISTIIFTQVGISEENQTDELYQSYFLMINEGNKIDFSEDKEALKQYVSTIYDHLLEFKGK